MAGTDRGACPLGGARGLHRDPVRPRLVRHARIGAGKPGPRVVLAGGWVLGDLARQFVATGFPWNPMGSVWAFPGRVGDVMLQPAALVSVHGLTMATLCWPARRRCDGAAGLFAPACCSAWIGFGVGRACRAAAAGSAVRVALVQGNVPQGQKWDPAPARRRVRRYLRLTAEAVRERGTRAAGGGMAGDRQPVPDGRQRACGDRDRQRGPRSDWRGAVRRADRPRNSPVRDHRYRRRRRDLRQMAPRCRSASISRAGPASAFVGAGRRVRARARTGDAAYPGRASGRRR